MDLDNLDLHLEQLPLVEKLGMCIKSEQVGVLSEVLEVVIDKKLEPEGMLSLDLLPLLLLHRQDQPDQPP
jgi:hypothetical protein